MGVCDGIPQWAVLRPAAGRCGVWVLDGDAVMVTEDEAKTMFCCSGAAAHPQSHGQCVASACMAWRWATEYQRVNDALDFTPMESTLRGFCGLAGKP